MRILEVTMAGFNRVIEANGIGVKKLPNLAPRFLRADIERLARDSVTPAKA